MNKILKLLLIVSLMIVSFECGYLCIKKDIVETNQKSKISNKSSSSITKNNVFSQADLALLNDPVYKTYLPLVYDETQNRIYIDLPAEKYLDMRKNMGIDYGRWIELTTFNKDHLVSFFATTKVKGKISDIKFDKPGKLGQEKYFYFVLTGEKGSEIDMYYNQDMIKKIGFFQMKDEKRIPMQMTDLKNGDSILIEDTTDLMVSSTSSDVKLTLTRL
ncbi:hypothetical protein GYA28_01285 [Candidatus Roizmanbacteria bacterium]|nr:hypothetical protein [Candidatus Roizmanbacteria bacterium]